MTEVTKVSLLTGVTEVTGVKKVTGMTEVTYVTSTPLKKTIYSYTRVTSIK